MKKVKENKIIDLRNKNEYEKAMELGKMSRKINLIFEKQAKNLTKK